MSHVSIYLAMKMEISKNIHKQTNSSLSSQCDHSFIHTINRENQTNTKKDYRKERK